MGKLFNGMIPFASAIKPTGAQPLDDRTVVKSFADLLLDETFGLAKYNGMLVAVVDDQQVYMLVDAANSASEDSWVAVGSGNGSLAVETYAEAVALATDDNIGQVIYVKTKSEYDADGEEGPEAAVEYDAAPYIVIGAGVLMKLAASTASGDIEGAVAELQTKVSTLEGSVADLQNAVDNIEHPVNDIQVNGESVLVDGVANIDLTSYAKSDDVNAVDAKVTTLIGDDAEKSVRTIANEELAAMLLSGDAEADFKTLQELAAWLENHPESVAEMNEAIAANTAAISTNAAAIEALQTEVAKKIENVKVNGVTGTVVDSVAEVKVDADDIELGFEITANNEPKYAATDKLSTVLQGIQNSITLASGGAYLGVVSGNGISVGDVVGNQQTISANISEDEGNLISFGTDGGLFAAMYYEGNDVEE